MNDPWPNLYQDPYAVKRIQKSVAVSNVLPNMSVLDVGSHKGELQDYLPSVTYHGLDTIKGDNIDGGFSLNVHFDRIFCLEVLEHLVNPEGTLKSIKAHLKDDGLAVISLPNEATVFHRLRSLFGTVDQECFSSSGKHLHLPSLPQARSFISKHLNILSEHFYINLSGYTSRQAKLLKMIKWLPEPVWQFLANRLPSLFARGFIFICC